MKPQNYKNQVPTAPSLNRDATEGLNHCGVVSNQKDPGGNYPNSGPEYFENHQRGTGKTSLLRGIFSGQTLSAPVAVLPLRLFLGLSFVAAGIYKLADPTFLDTKAPNYIGNQLAGFALNSPVGGFLSAFGVENATLFGLAVMFGEIAIGLGTLVGLFSRTAAFFGALLSLVLWLSASWSIRPFFLGSDLPYMMGWMVLLVAGAHPRLSLDGLLKRKMVAGPNGPMVDYDPVFINQPVSNELARRRFITVAGASLVAGIATLVAWGNTEVAPSNEFTSTQGLIPAGTVPVPTTQAAGNPPQSTTLPPTSASPTLTSNPTLTPGTTNLAPVQPTAPVAATSPAVASPRASANSKPGVILGALSVLPVGSSLNFTTPDTKISAVVYHTKEGPVKAFSRTCTHEGCIISFSQGAQSYICPCHGAIYDPSTGIPIQGPARRPLQSIKVGVDAGGNIVYYPA